MTFGLTNTGFTPKRLLDVQTSMNNALQAALGSGINLDPRGPLGQVRDTIANEVASVWEAAELVYLSEYPDTASGQSLDKVAAISGITRLLALASTVNVDFYGTAGTVVPQGTLAHVNGNPAAQFGTLGAVTISASPVSAGFQINFSTTPLSGTWTATFGANTTAPIAYNASAATVQAAFQALAYPGSGGITVTGNSSSGYVCTYAGANANLGGQTLPTVSSSLTPVSLVLSSIWTELGGYKATAATAAVSTGVIPASAQSITAIDTPVVGVTGCTNWAAAVTGSAIETDAALRLRRVLQLQQASTSTVGGIATSIQNNVTGVSSVAVFENTTDVTNGQGLPPHSIQVVVQGGTDADVANQIWNSKPAGIATYGSSSYVITDSSGLPHTIYFTRSTSLPIYLAITLTRNYNPAEGPVYPATGDAQVLSNLLAYGNTLVGGQWVIYNQLVSVISQVPGIFGVTLYMGTAPAPVSSANIVVGGGQVATFSAPNISIA